MHNLLDNDVAIKTSQYQIVDEFDSFCAALKNCYVLETLKYRIHYDNRDKGVAKIGNDAAFDTILRLLNQANEISDSSYDNDTLAQLEQVDEVDAGEAILFSVALKYDQALTFTGDKRCIKAISAIFHKNNELDRITGRIKCLEQSVAEMVINHTNHLHLWRKIRGYEFDSSLRACFASNDKTNILDGLRSYYNDLNKNCWYILAPFPEN